MEKNTFLLNHFGDDLQLNILSKCLKLVRGLSRLLVKMANLKEFLE